MQTFSVSTFLRRVLLADAATCLAAGLLMTLGANLLAELFNLPVELSCYAGLSLFPFAAFLIYLATSQTVSPLAIWLVIALNALWTLDSFLILLGGWIEPTVFGVAFVVAQAVGVGFFAALEYVGWRKSDAVTA